jgi:sugar (pentulose or hexulose) kinase
MSENNEVLVQLAQVKGQLTAMTQLMQQNHDSTHQRINDFRHAVEGRIAGVEARLDKVENNERGTAIKAAGGGALSAAIVTATIKALEFLAGR